MSHKDSKGTLDVECLHCKSPWSDFFVRQHLPACVFRRLTRVTKKRLRDEETPYMAETQYFVRLDERIETERQTAYVELCREWGAAAASLASITIKKARTKEDRAESNSLRRQINQISSDMSAERDRLRLWRNECVVSRQYIDLVPEEIRDRLFPTIHFQTSSTSRSTPLLPCPVDGCRGIVMLPSHACGLCNATLCPHCHSVCGTDSTASTASTHVCDPKHIQTVAEILQNTRACPKCATRIHRIDGCDQMWCTRCHTAFHWQNGMVLKNTMVHNPHFVQYQREQREARSAAEVYNNCDGLPEIQIVNNHLSTYANNQWSSEYPFRSVIRDVHRQCRDAQDLADRAAYGGGNNHNHNRRDPFFRNIDLRLRFLQNKMSSAEFETQLLRRHNQECVLHTCRSVWVLFVSVCTDVFHRFLHDNTLDTADSRAGYITEFSEIIRLINDRIRVVNTAYQWTSVPTIMPITDRFFRQTRQAQADELELRRPDRPEGPQVAAESSSSEDSF